MAQKRHAISQSLLPLRNQRVIAASHDEVVTGPLRQFGDQFHTLARIQGTDIPDAKLGVRRKQSNRHNVTHRIGRAVRHER